MSFRRFMSRPLLLLAGTLAMGLGTVDIRAQSTGASSSTYSADAVRAAYLVNFIQFADWPDRPPETPLTIGVANGRDLEDRLIKITDGRLFQGSKRVRIRRLNSPVDATECQLIYIYPAQRTDPSHFSSSDWIQAVNGLPVLTVAEEEGFLLKGGMINLYAENNNLRFEISPKAAEAVGLKLSSRLLAIARIVNVTARSKSAPPAP
jgi:hypothetical protein